MFYTYKNNKKVKIKTLEEWEHQAGPKEQKHWKDNRSAKETAKLWLTYESPSFPNEVNQLFENSNYFGKISSWEAEPEAKVHFDSFSGPANIDLLIDATDSYGNFIIGLEAKADETFSSLVSQTFTDALEAKIKNPDSNAIKRIIQLATSLFSDRQKNQKKIGDIRYQLLTGLAATISKANKLNYKRAVFLIHEFDTNATIEKRHHENQKDLNIFIERLTNDKTHVLNPTKLVGPIKPPGSPLFDLIPQIFIGKAKRII